MTATQATEPLVIGQASEEVRARFAAARRNREYLQRHWDELLRRYPKQWIAIADGKVIARAQDLDTLASLVREQPRPPLAVDFEFMETEDKIYTL